MRRTIDDIRSTAHIRTNIIKAEYLEKQGFKFYEKENLPSKPFGWIKGKVRIPYNKLVKLSFEKLKEYVELRLSVVKEG